MEEIGVSPISKGRETLHHVCPEVDCKRPWPPTLAINMQSWGWRTKEDSPRHAAAPPVEGLAKQPWGWRTTTSKESVSRSLTRDYDNYHKLRKSADR